MSTLTPRQAIGEWLSKRVGRRLPLDLVLAVSRAQLAWHHWRAGR